MGKMIGTISLFDLFFCWSQVVDVLISTKTFKGSETDMAFFSSLSFIGRLQLIRCIYATYCTGYFAELK
jgi:hypothetical protein